MINNKSNSIILSSIRVSGRIINRRMSKEKIGEMPIIQKEVNMKMMMCPFSSAKLGPVGKSEPVELDNPLLASLVQQQKSLASSSLYFHCYKPSYIDSILHLTQGKKNPF